LKEQIKALKNQIEKEKARLVGGSNNRLNRLALEYLTLKLEAEFYADVYKATLSAYEQTRVDASRKLKNLVIIQAPNLPEEPLYPKKVYNLTLAFILLLMFYGIIVFLIELIKEHMV
jgi:capsular polysaccharide transport system permease protein